MAKLPDQKNPLAAQERTSGSSAKILRQRQHWMAAARCACRIAVGLAVVPDEKKISARSVGATSAPIASISSAGTLSLRRKSGHDSIAPADAGTSPMHTALRRNGSLGESVLLFAVP